MTCFPNTPAGISPSPHAKRLTAIGGDAGQCDRPVAVYAAIVLERLTYWWQKGTRILIDGEWRAKPRDQLMRECLLSRGKLDRALAMLKAMGLIVTSQHRFGKTKMAVMHYRIQPRAVQTGAAPSSCVNPAAAPLEADPVKPGFLKVVKPVSMDGIGLSVTSTKVSNDTFSEVPESCVPANAVSACGAGQQKISEEDKNQGSENSANVELHHEIKATDVSAGEIKKGGMSAKEMLAFKQASGTFPGQKPKNTGGKSASTGQKMSEIYLDAWNSRYPGKFHAPLTAKTIGQLGMLRDKIEAVRPGKSEQIVRNVVANWSAFVAKAETDAGGFNLPEMPVPGLILKFATVALNLKEAKEVVVTTSIPGKPSVKPQDAQLIAQPVAEEKPATLQEILDLINSP